MNIKIIFSLGLTLLLVTLAKGNCPTCGLTSGTNVCGCQVNLVRPVRPVRIPPAPPRIVCTKLPGVDRLKPVGDACSCGNSIVSPAYVPKQRCNVCQQRQHHHIEAFGPPPPHHGLHYPGLIPAPPQLNNFEPEEFGGEFEYQSEHQYPPHPSGNLAIDDYYGSYYNPQPPAPADAVSLTLAYGLAQQAQKNIPEERLAFGFRELPKDIPLIKPQIDIPEERLFTVDKQIVELKPPTRGSCHNIEQEAEQDLLQIQQEELDAQQESFHGERPYLSYRDIGYAPERGFGSPSFIVNPSVPEPAYEEVPPPQAHGFRDGFIPGRVIQTNPEEYLEEADVSDAYGSDEDIDIGYRVIGGSYGGHYGPNSFSGNQGNRDFLLGRLGAGQGCGCGRH